MSHVHPQARTTPRTRAEIRSSPDALKEVAERYNTTVATVRKWRAREDMQDRSHRPNTLSTTLTPAQEALVVELRRMLLLPLDDLLAITHEFINPAASRSGLNRCLIRHGVATLASLVPVVEGQVPAKKTFKDYEPGFVHVDIKYLPQMPDETHRRYLFVAIDRATRWVYFRTYANQSQASSTDFLRRLKRAAPMVIQKLLTDNGTQFTDRFTGAGNGASGKHAFDLACHALGIEHRLCPPRHPQTNGMVERFNGRISDLMNQTRFKTAAELESTLKLYLITYNHHIPQRALKHQSPVQALKAWRGKKPDLFVERVHELAELDTYRQGQHRSRFRPAFTGAVERTKPAEVAFQVRRGDALEPSEPGFEPAVRRVGVLDVPGAEHAFTGAQVHSLVLDAQFFGHSRGRRAVRAQHSIALDARLERLAQTSLGHRLQKKVSR